MKNFKTKFHPLVKKGFGLLGKVQAKTMEAPNDKIIIPIPQNALRVQLHLAWQEQGYTYGGELVLLFHNQKPKMALRQDILPQAPEPELPQHLNWKVGYNHIQLIMQTQAISGLRYQIVSSL